MLLFKNSVSKLWFQKANFIFILFLSTFFISISAGLVSPIVNVNQNYYQFLQDTNAPTGVVSTKSALNEQELYDNTNVKVERYFTKDVSYESATLRLMSATNSINTLQISKGNEPKSANEIVVDEHFAQAHNLAVGDALTLENRVYAISGFGYSPAYVILLKSDDMLVPDSNAFGVGYVTDKSVFSETQFRYFYKTNENSNMEKFHNQVGNEILTWDVFQESVKYYVAIGKLSSFTIIAAVFPIIVFFAVCILLYNTFSKMIRSNIKEYGIVLSMGYNKTHLFSMELIPFISICLIGYCFGNIGGYFINMFVNKLLYEQFGFSPIIDNTLFLYTTAFFLIFSLTLILFYITRVIKIYKFEDIDLIRGTFTKSVKRVKTVKKIALLSFEKIYMVRNTLRGKLRIWITIFGVVSSLFVLTYGFVLVGSINETIDKGINGGVVYSAKVVYDGPQLVKQEALNTFNARSATSNNQIFTIYGIDRVTDAFNIKNENITTDAFNQGVTISKGLSQKINKIQGDVITLYDQIQNKNIDIKIDFVDMELPIQALFMPRDLYNETFKLNAQMYTGVFLKENQVLKITDNVLTKETKSELVESYNKFMEPLIQVVYLITILSGVLCFVSIYSVINIIVDEDKNDIAMLKILGYTVRKTLALVMIPIGWLMVLGMLASIILSRVVMVKIVDKVSEKLPISLFFNFSIIIALLVLLFIVAIYVLSYLTAYYKLVTISETLVLKEQKE